MPRPKINREKLKRELASKRKQQNTSNEKIDPKSSVGRFINWAKKIKAQKSTLGRVELITELDRMIDKVLKKEHLEKKRTKKFFKQQLKREMTPEETIANYMSKIVRATNRILGMKINQSKKEQMIVQIIEEVLSRMEISSDKQFIEDLEYFQKKPEDLLRVVKEGRKQLGKLLHFGAEF